MINPKVMFYFKNLSPFIVAMGVFLLASNSPMWRQMNTPRPVENEIKTIPLDMLK